MMNWLFNPFTRIPRAAWAVVVLACLLAALVVLTWTGHGCIKYNP